MEFGQLWVPYNASDLEVLWETHRNNTYFAAESRVKEVFRASLRRLNRLYKSVAALGSRCPAGFNPTEMEAQIQEAKCLHEDGYHSRSWLIIHTESHKLNELLKKHWAGMQGMQQYFN